MAGKWAGGVGVGGRWGGGGGDGWERKGLDQAGIGPHIV